MSQRSELGRVGLTKAAWEDATSGYRRSWRVAVCVVTPNGVVVAGRVLLGHGEAGRVAAGLAVAEGVRWGEPTLVRGPRQRLAWAVPLMHNAKVLGGLLAAASERRVIGAAARLDVRRACSDLRRLAERLNVTNAALLTEHRAAYERERQRAEAIHELKGRGAFDLRGLLQEEEPALLAAVRRGDRGAARQALNRVLVAVHHAGSQRELIKSFFMELVVALSRSAVEAGADPQTLLGRRFERLTHLAAVQDEEALASWLHQTLEQVMQALHDRRGATAGLLMQPALRYMAEHCGERIGREDVAAQVNLSPAHFSRVFKAQTGRRFVEVLARMRVQRAAQRLRETDSPLSLVAAECGFPDQSYFTKVFRQHFRLTPHAYRRQHRGHADA